MSTHQFLTAKSTGLIGMIRISPTNIFILSYYLFLLSKWIELESLFVRIEDRFLKKRPLTYFHFISSLVIVS